MTNYVANIDADAFRFAMRQAATAVGILATDGKAGRAGVTVSALCSMSADPPSVLCCIHRDSRALPALVGNGVFSANFLAADQSGIADVFAGLVPEHRENRFAIGDWHEVSTGAPVLGGTSCSFDCEVDAIHEYGTHRIVIGRVKALEVSGGEPLVYSNQGYRKLLHI